MGWLKKTFLYREDYIPALQGLRGAAMLWFFHWSFYNQFDPAKLSRIIEGKPWLGTALDALRYAVAPGEMAAVVMGVICGFLLTYKDYGKSNPGRYFLNSLARIYGVYLVAILPHLSYAQPDLVSLAKMLVLLQAPADFLQFTTFLGVILAYKLLVFSTVAAGTLSNTTLRMSVKALLVGLVLLVILGSDLPLGFTLGLLVASTGMHTLREKFTTNTLRPGTLLAIGCAVSLAPLPLPARAFLVMAIIAHVPTDFAFAITGGARLLSHPVLRYFGAVALPFFLIHTTWGFRLSRSILQGELHSVQAIAAHYALSLAFSTVFAGFLHVFFERPSFLRNAPAADTKPSSVTQGVFP